MNKVTSSVTHVEVSADREGQRLDNFLSARLKGVPRSVIYRVIRKGQVRVNGGRAKPATRLNAGDLVRIPPASIRENPEGDIPPAVLKLIRESILFESRGIMVVNKPSGMAVHAGSGMKWGLVDVVRKLRPEHSIDLVHRLDRETSGCLLLAMNGDALRELNQQITENTMDKRYLCLLDGRLKHERTDITEPIGQYERAGQKFMRVDVDGKPAHTIFRLLQNYGPYSFVEVELLSGRTHQIRVHAAHMGMALPGDKRYSASERLKHWKAAGLKRMFLHAHQLRFLSMDGREQLVSSTLPEDLADLLERLE